MSDKLPTTIPEDTIRETRDDLVGRVIEQQKKLGMIPSSRAAEEWVEPIIRQTVADEEERRQRDAIAVRPQPIAEEERHSTEVLSGVPIERTDLRRGIGTIGWDQDGELIVGPDFKLPQRNVTKRTEQQLLRDRLILLSRIPDWRDKVIAAFIREGTYSEKADFVLEVLDQSNKLFGDWRQHREESRPIIVGGK